MEKNIKTAYLAIILISFIFYSPTGTVNSQQTENQPSVSTPVSTPVPTVPASATSTRAPVIKYIESEESGGGSVIFAPPQTSIQQIQSRLGSTIKGGISNVITVPTESPGVVSSVFMQAVSALEVKPTEIFTPVLSEATNITVSAEVQDNKVVYLLAAPVSASVIKNPEATTIGPLFDLKTEAPVEFKLKNNEMVINNEQSVNYGEVKSTFSGSGSIPLAVISVQATAISPVYNLEVKPENNGATMKFITKEQKEITSTIQSDFKIENKQLYVVQNNQQQVLNVLPPEISSAIENTGGKITNTISIAIESNKPVYNFEANEPFRLLWVIPMNVDAVYKISGEGKILKAKRPWYTILGDKASPQLFK